MRLEYIGIFWYVCVGRVPISRWFATQGEAEAELARREAWTS